MTAQATATERFVDVGDTELLVVELGAGVPVIVLHGGLGLDHSYLRPWLDTLADAARVVYVDQRGNGRSPVGRPLTDVDLSTWADDVEALCRRLGVDEVVLFGHSFGGFVALEAALRHPKRIAGLVLCGTGAAFDHLDAVVANLDRRDATESQRRAFTGEPFANDDELAAWLQDAAPIYLHPGSTVRLDLGGVRCRVDTLARGADAVAGWDRRPDLGSVRAPALVLSGRHDVVMPVEIGGAALAAGLAEATSVVFERSGHLPFVEEPGAFARVVRTWLRSLPVAVRASA